MISPNLPGTNPCNITKSTMPPNREYLSYVWRLNISMPSTIQPIGAPHFGWILIEDGSASGEKNRGGWQLKKPNPGNFKMLHARQNLPRFGFSFFWYTPQNKHGTSKWTLGKGDSYWKPSFSGSMFVLGGVNVGNLFQSHGSHLRIPSCDLLEIESPWPFRKVH